MQGAATDNRGNTRLRPSHSVSLLESCISFRFYARIIETSLARSLSYLTMLAAISAFSALAYFHQVILPKLDKASDKLPPFTIKNGKVSVEGGPQSATLYADPEKILRIDLDLDGQKGRRLAATGYEYTVVITRYAIILKQVTGQVNTLSLPYGFSLTIHKNALHFFIESWAWLIVLLGFLGSFAFFWVLRFLQAFLLSIPGLVLWGLLRRDLTYGKLLTLCIYALTPAILCGMVIVWLNAAFVLPRIVIEFQWIIYFLVALEYLFGGLLALPEPSTMKVHDKPSLDRLL
jgi:hypothetical protein